ncbi:MAG TPA: acylneuraminate cytidylyltransferase family protein [Burkholderiales bacterium]|nr:acylneuraminate cytidylyltransferase family protein [Burkholderiales bacterium]
MARARYLGIIPARGGSKRVPGKNLRPLAGRPLIDYIIAAACSSRRLTAVVVSTDSEKIARYARSRGADPQGLRPAGLARDDSPVAGALRDALAKYERGHPPVDAVVLLQPTSPFLTASHIDRAIVAFETRRADTITAVRRAREHPWWTWRPSRGLLRPWYTLGRMAAPRGDLPEAWVETGAVMVIRPALIARGMLYGGRVAPFPIDEAASVDIDTPLDFAWAEFLLSRPGSGFPRGVRS